MAKRVHSNRSGFTLFELLIIVAIAIVVAVIAVPNVALAVSSARLRASMTSLSGVLQNTRILAVRQNRMMTTRMTAGSGGLTAFAKLATDSSDVTTHEVQIEMEAPIIRVTAPSGPDEPSELDIAVLGFTPETGDPSFNTRGLPCVYSMGSCTNHGFLFYFHDTRSGSTPGWSALSISPAGRIKKWFWNGSTWLD